MRTLHVDDAFIKLWGEMMGDYIVQHPAFSTGDNMQAMIGSFLWAAQSLGIQAGISQSSEVAQQLNIPDGVDTTVHQLEHYLTLAICEYKKGVEAGQLHASKLTTAQLMARIAK